MSASNTPAGSMSDTLRAVESLVLSTDNFKDEQLAFFTSQEDTTVITDATGTKQTIPTYFALMRKIIEGDFPESTIASHLATPRLIELIGIITGQIPFDGTKNVAITTEIADGALSMTKVAGLNSALNATDAKSQSALDAVTNLQGQIGTQLSGWTYNQVTASPVWVVSHGMNKKPDVTVLNTSGQKVWCGIEYVDLNTVRITSAFPFAGSAIFN